MVVGTRISLPTPCPISQSMFFIHVKFVVGANNRMDKCELVVVGTLTGTGNLARNSHVGFVSYRVVSSVSYS